MCKKAPPAGETFTVSFCFRLQKRFPFPQIYFRVQYSASVIYSHTHAALAVSSQCLRSHAVSRSDLTEQSGIRVRWRGLESTQQGSGSLPQLTSHTERESRGSERRFPQVFQASHRLDLTEDRWPCNWDGFFLQFSRKKQKQSQYGSYHFKTLFHTYIEFLKWQILILEYYVYIAFKYMGIIFRCHYIHMVIGEIPLTRIVFPVCDVISLLPYSLKQHH